MPDSSFGFGAPAVPVPVALARACCALLRGGASSCWPPIVADSDTTGRHQWQTPPVSCSSSAKGAGQVFAGRVQAKALGHQLLR